MNDVVMALNAAANQQEASRLRVATEPRLSPDGRWAVVTLQTVAPSYDGYRQALWLVLALAACAGAASTTVTVAASARV